MAAAGGGGGGGWLMPWPLGTLMVAAGGWSVAFDFWLCVLRTFPGGGEGAG